MNTETGQGKQALITGASSGIGEAYARKLASLGYDLIIIARRGDRLEALAQELQGKHPVSVRVLACDLAADAGMAAVEEEIRKADNLTVLVNNAGFGINGEFAKCSVDKSTCMIDVHIVAGTRLVKAALPGMIKQREGRIINVSSLGAFLQARGNVVYGATKAYLVAFSQNLQVELKGTGVTVQALCPGFTRTGFQFTAEFEGVDFSYIPSLFWMKPEAVVEQSWRDACKGRTVCIPGIINRAGYAFSPIINFISRRLPSKGMA